MFVLAVAVLDEACESSVHGDHDVLCLRMAKEVSQIILHQNA